MPPREYISITKEETFRKYLDAGGKEGFKARFIDCKERTYGYRKRGFRVRDNDGFLMCSVLEYSNPGGVPQVVVRHIREGDIMYYIIGAAPES